MSRKFLRKCTSVFLALVFAFGGFSPVLAAPPDPPTLISPSGDIGANYSPSFIWNEVAGATRYHLWINGPSGPALDQEYEASFICSSGICTVQSPVVLGDGAHTWWVQGWNLDGYGPWSSGMNFSIGTPPPVNAPGNDDFASATVIPLPLPFDNTVDTTGATTESGEPTPTCAFYGAVNRSVWYAFTPTTSGGVTASIPTSSVTPVFAVYTGNSVDNLTEIGCQYYSGSQLTFQANANTTYHFLIGNLYPWDPGGSIQFHLDVPQPPVAGFYFSPSAPSVFDTIQFYDSSYDPAQVGFQSFNWNFGDGATSTDGNPTHKYASDGDYTVEHSVTTTDGRIASTSQVVQVRTHDVSLTKVEAPESAKVGKSEKITVSVVNTSAYPESVTVQLYRSVAGGGFEWVGNLSKSNPITKKDNKPTNFTFNYTFTADDLAIGKVIFRAEASIDNANDAFPQDNARLSSLTMVKKK